MKEILLVNLALASLMFASVNIQAKPSIKDAGTSINEQVPEITALDISGNKQTIKQLSGPKGLVLVFFRSADWCPYCKKHLVEINMSVEKIKALGFNVAAVSYDSLEILEKFAKEKQLIYPLLSDQNHQTMMAFNVLNDEEMPGDKHYGIPFPGVMIISAEATLLYKYFYKGYKKRIKIPKLLKRLESITN